MLFNSIQFAIFLPIVFALYWWAFRKKLHLQNLFLVAAGYFFYGWWDWRFLFLLLFTSSVDFVTAYFIDKTTNHQHRKTLVGITLVCNLGVLGYFKYCNFFVDSFITAFAFFNVSLSAPALKVILPVGISFYTFQSIAYVIDVYRGDMKACKNYITFMAFVSFFPQLVAGPISRAKDLLTQFYQPRRLTYEAGAMGLRLILYGLFKKVVIADNLSRLVDVVYSSPGNYTGTSNALATLFFALQIYCDFSGYSDIAIGTAKLFGFELMQNFRTPYFSGSLREFWQRWHISLSTWFRDYLYIPLGGNRVSTPRRYFNLLVTFLVSGLWHGANWTFVVWGAIHGVVVAFETFCAGRIKFRLPLLVRQVMVFLIVCFAWIFFRANSWQSARLIISNFSQGWNFTQVSGLISQVYFSWVFFTTLMVITLVFLIMESRWQLQPVEALGFRSRVVRWSVYYLLILLIVFVGMNDNSPNFIYFKF